MPGMASPRETLPPELTLRHPWETNEPGEAVPQKSRLLAGHLPEQLKKKWVVYCQRCVRICCAVGSSRCRPPQIPTPGRAWGSDGIAAFCCASEV